MKANILFLFSLAILFASCNNFYSVEDFPSVEKTDAHFHIYTTEGISLEQAKKDNFKLFSVNVYHGNCEDVVVKNQPPVANLALHTVRRQKILSNVGLFARLPANG